MVRCKLFRRITLVVLLVLNFTTSASAQNYDFDEQSNSYRNILFGFNWANDSWLDDFPYLDRDQGFTNGVVLNFGGLVSNHLADWLLEKLVEDKYQKLSYTLSVASYMYTPKQFTQTGIQLNDRPYAGLGLFTFSLNGKRVNAREPILWNLWGDGMPVSDDPGYLYAPEVVYETVGLSFGALGDAGAAWAQAYAHFAVNQPQPAGWDTRIANRLAFQVSFNSVQKTLLFGLLPDSPDSWFKVFARSTTELGNVWVRQTYGFSIKSGWLPDDKQLMISQGKNQSDAVPDYFDIFIDPAVTFSLWDGTLVSGNSDHYNVTLIPVVFAVPLGLDARTTLFGVSFHGKFTCLELTTANYTNMNTDGTVNLTPDVSISAVRKFEVDVAY